MRHREVLGRMGGYDPIITMVRLRGVESVEG
jgi:hypothetical protein